MKQMNRKTLIIAVVAALVAVAGILAILYFAVWQQPGKKDFSDAKTKTEKISTYSGSALLGDFITKVNEQSRAGVVQPKLAESASAEKKKVDDAIDTRARLAKEVESSLVMRDKDVKKAYDTYIAQEAKYGSYIKGYAATYPAYKSSFATCVKVFQINDEAGEDVTKYAALHRAAAKACYEDLDIVAKSAVTPLAEYGKEFKRIVTERQKVFDGLEKKTYDTDKAGDRIKQLGADYTKANPSEALSKFVKEASFNGELNDLIKLLDDKAKAAK